MGISKKRALRSKNHKTTLKAALTNEGSKARAKALKLEAAEKVATTKTELHGNKGPDPNDPSYKDFSLVSRSTARRRKRKLRDSLKPKMSDMASTLNEIAIESPNEGSNGYIGVKNKHIPNPHKLRGKKVIEKTEIKNFQGTLTDENYRHSPFATLRNKIAGNMNVGSI